MTSLVSPNKLFSEQGGERRSQSVQSVCSHYFRWSHLAKAQRAESKLWNVVCAEKEWQVWAIPLEKGLLGGLVLGGVWKVGAQALSTIFARGKPYSEALLTVPKLPML